MTQSIDIQSKDIKLVPIDQIKESHKNRNSHSAEQIDRLAKIIQYQGFRNPLIVSNQSGLLVAGHGRLMAARKLGLTELPVMYQDFKDSDAEYAAMVSDNSIASWAELDLAGINSDIGDLGPDFDIELLGVEGFTLDPHGDFKEPDPKKDPTQKDAMLKSCPNCGVFL